jgi:RAD54-like protein 2
VIHVQLLVDVLNIFPQVIQEWAKGGGVLLIGYELYRQLSLKRPNKANSKKRRRKHQDEVVDVDEDDKNKALLDG